MAGIASPPGMAAYNVTEAGVIGLGVNAGAYMTETIRGAIIAIDKGQREAARKGDPDAGAGKAPRPGGHADPGKRRWIDPGLL